MNMLYRKWLSMNEAEQAAYLLASGYEVTGYSEYNSLGVPLFVEFKKVPMMRRKDDRVDAVRSAQI